MGQVPLDLYQLQLPEPHRADLSAARFACITAIVTTIVSAIAITITITIVTITITIATTIIMFIQRCVG